MEDLVEARNRVVRMKGEDRMKAKER